MGQEADDAVARAVAQKNREWTESLDYVYESQGPKRVLELLRHLQVRAQQHGIHAPFSANTPYINTIPASRQSVFPGGREIERRIKSIIRWNAMATVKKARTQLKIDPHRQNPLFV